MFLSALIPILIHFFYCCAAGVGAEAACCSAENYCQNSCFAFAAGVAASVVVFAAFAFDVVASAFDSGAVVFAAFAAGVVVPTAAGGDLAAAVAASFVADGCYPVGHFAVVDYLAVAAIFGGHFAVAGYYSADCSVPAAFFLPCAACYLSSADLDCCYCLKYDH